MAHGWQGMRLAVIRNTQRLMKCDGRAKNLDLAFMSLNSVCRGRAKVFREFVPPADEGLVPACEGDKRDSQWEIAEIALHKNLGD